MVIEFWNTGLAILAVRSPLRFPSSFTIIPVTQSIIFLAAARRWWRYFRIRHHTAYPITGQRHDSEEHTNDLDDKSVSIIR
jgi:hypothetical protein